jgi:signal transduction histidine kinase/ActR/RegA family two-component response regulator
LPDGSVRRISSTGQFAFDENGGPIRGAGVAVDVTDRRFLEEQLRQSQKMEAVGHLAGGIAHDFNNILTVIKGYSGLALEVLSKDDPLWSYLEDIQKAGLRAASLTSQLLAFSRKQVLQPKVVNLNSIVSEVENLLRRVIGEDIQLRTALTATGNVKADPNQIEQVILNLVVNARDAMPKGGKLTVEVRDVDLSAEYAHGRVGVQPGPHVMLTVTDSGIGMDKETQSKIFEPFYTTKNPGKGTGLGLSMVYGIVKQSGGSVWVYSEPECGTTFKIYFPRVDEAASPYTKTVRHEKLIGTETILLTEDDESVRTLTRDVLQRYGYQVIVAADGKEAISISQKHRKKIHLLITDVIMPQMRGPDLAKKLMRKWPNLKVLYMSGYTDSVVLDSGFIDPAVHFLQKPFTPDLLASAVREVLGGPST